MIIRMLFSSEGDKKRAERAELNSADGNTREFHDQFYRDHKLLLVLFRGLAVMPITRASPGKSLSMRHRLRLVILFIYRQQKFVFV